ncbi:TPM domain-containing protein [Anaerosporobacter sp.]|uniref:TPM domain-containing protein n=1 Tax=Anaerosporobacter sp. TaxID=1872529 RepID=UPI00286EEBB7|nr:TPM domain-containing protein [Anaerosporobacter sp.]
MKTVKKLIPPSLLILVCLLLSLVIVPVLQVAASKTTSYIIDNANLLSSDEQTELNKLASKYSKDKSMSIVTITTNDTNNLSTTNYASNYYDTYIHDTEGYTNDCVIFMIDMEHRNVNIFAYEDAAIYMDTSRCDKVLDVVTSKLSDGDYYNAIKTFLEKTNKYLGTEPTTSSSNTNSNSSNSNSTPSKQTPYTSEEYDTATPNNIFYNIWFQLALAVIIGIISVSIMVSNSGGKVTTNSSTYLDHSNSKLTGCYDNYVRTTTTRRKKPEHNDNNNNHHSGGSSTGGTTSGGSSFSSGHQRSF